MEAVSSTGLVDQVFLRCVQSCFEPIMITDRMGSLRYVNPAWVKTYGYKKEEAIGQKPSILRSEFQDDEFYRRMWQTILNPEIGFWRGEVLNKAKDGHIVPVLLTITPYHDSSGENAGYVGIAVDLSDQKTMQQQILRQDRLASIGLLSGGLAHEIGNPLGVIRGRAELLLSQIKGNEVAEKNIDVIVGQIDRISTLIQSLLRVSRVPDQILLRKINLKDALDEVFILTSESCKLSGVELKSKNVDMTVYAEPGHLQQLFLNLILNSLHAIDEHKLKNKGPKQAYFIEVEAQASSAEKCVISVTDNGCGISSENIHKLFQPFYTTKSAGKGTGLGLMIVLKLVEEMGGKICVESPGISKGATFKIELQTPNQLIS